MRYDSDTVTVEMSRFLVEEHLKRKLSNAEWKSIAYSLVHEDPDIKFEKYIAEAITFGVFDE